LHKKLLHENILKNVVLYEIFWDIFKKGNSEVEFLKTTTTTNTDSTTTRTFPYSSLSPFLTQLFHKGKWANFKKLQL
jgi:hypothetical protein